MRNYLSNRLGQIHVRGILECGFFMDLPTAAGIPLMTPIYQVVAQMQNATSAAGNLDAGCLASYPTELWRCFLAQYTLPHVTAPFFAVNSVYDRWQTVNILQVDENCATHDPSKCTPSEATAIGNLSQWPLPSSRTTAPRALERLKRLAWRSRGRGLTWARQRVLCPSGWGLACCARAVVQTPVSHVCPTVCVIVICVSARLSPLLFCVCSTF